MSVCLIKLNYNVSLCLCLIKHTYNVSLHFCGPCSAYYSPMGEIIKLPHSQAFLSLIINGGRKKEKNVRETHFFLYSFLPNWERKWKAMRNMYTRVQVTTNICSNVLDFHGWGMHDHPDHHLWRACLPPTSNQDTYACYCVPNKIIIRECDSRLKWPQNGTLWRKGSLINYNSATNTSRATRRYTQPIHLLKYQQA